MEPKSEQALEAQRAEMAAAKIQAQTALPQLIAQRQALEREAGALAVSARNRKRVAMVMAAIAAILGSIAGYQTVTTGEPPIILFIVTAIPAFIAAFMMFESQGAESAREKQLEALHDRMLTIGRHISRAEKTLRD